MAALPHGARIVNGSDASIEDYPWMAVIQYRSDIKCSGTIISDTWVLTNAACVQKFEPTDYWVRVGTADRTNGGLLYNVTRNEYNHKFSSKKRDYDVGAVQIDGTFTFTDSVQTNHKEEDCYFKNKDSGRISFCTFEDIEEDLVTQENKKQDTVEEKKMEDTTHIAYECNEGKISQKANEKEDMVMVVDSACAGHLCNEVDKLTNPITLSTEAPPDGALVTAMGWGTLWNGGYPAEVLQAVDLYVVNWDECSEVDIYSGKLTERQFCAGWSGGGKGTCGRDKGGPAVLNGVQVGITSWSNGCAMPGYPSIFTSIVQVRDWITETTGV
ncbi:trypsin-2-like [Schistocerca piceifrons]|uniref:trypsin-2-like n=1 Tax=Schistocerca piceifrons TaxID=274613 RepID=UPI001F5F706B|nr:trypsin-2-like [Schistocerca piceifrons]